MKVHRISRNIMVVALLLGLSGCASTKVIKSPVTVQGLRQISREVRAEASD